MSFATLVRAATPTSATPLPDTIAIPDAASGSVAAAGVPTQRPFAEGVLTHTATPQFGAALRTIANGIVGTPASYNPLFAVALRGREFKVGARASPASAEARSNDAGVQAD